MIHGVTYYHFTGTDHRGTGRSGVTMEDPVKFTARAYARGWRTLSLITNDDDARQVGWIGTAADILNQRLWWAESQRVTTP